MTIKFSARGISAAFRTPQELIEQDAVTLKPTVGGEVIVSGAGDSIALASNYTEEGGCTVGEDSYPDTKSLNDAGISVISDAFSAYNCDAEEVLNVPMVERWKDDPILMNLYFYQTKTVTFTLTSQTTLEANLRKSVGGAKWTDYNPNKIYKVVKLYYGSSERLLDDKQAGSLHIESNGDGSAKLVYTYNNATGSYLNTKGIQVSVE